LIDPTVTDTHLYLIWTKLAYAAGNLDRERIDTMETVPKWTWKLTDDDLEVIERAETVVRCKEQMETNLSHGIVKPSGMQH